MGSSVSGSLDKYAKVPGALGTAAAVGSGKVKLPETGAIGAVQSEMIANAEAKQAMNKANMERMQQQQNQRNLQNQMFQRMQQQPNQMTDSASLGFQPFQPFQPYSPAPYANGGNVTLRRKMFKLGGSASAHGTGLTSGLSFNQGGAVVKPGPDGQLRQHAVAGGIARGILAALGLRGAPAITRSVRRTGRAGAPDIMDFIRFGPGGRPASASVALPASRARQIARAAELALTPVAGGLGLAGIGSAALLPDAGEDAPPIAGLAQDVAEGVLDLSPVGLGYMALDKLFTRPSEYEFETLTGKPSIFGDEPVAEKLGDDDRKDLGMTPAELAALADERQKENLQEAMAMYQELIRGEDNTNKLMTLGDAAIAAGSALMEGEGYGGAATAFNEPLAQARAQQEALDQESRAAAAQLAIGEDIASRQLQEAQAAELLATGAFDTEEEINAILLGRRFGISRTIPEDDKGEIDNDAVKQSGAGVYVDPKQRFGGLFIAVNSNNEDLITNDPDQAKEHAKS